MRKIKFRGLRTDGKGWVYGFYTEDQHGNCYIVDVSENPTEKSYPFFKVIPETIGQFTGLHDKNGKEIYEGDILKGQTGKNYEVIFKNGWFMAKNGTVAILGAEMKVFEVIGNTYENPELLNGVFG